MSKPFEKLQARKMRREGYSVKNISHLLQVSRSSISIWVRDIILTPAQLRQLNQNSIDGRNKGRTVTSIMYQQRRQQLRHEALKYGLRLINTLSNKELLIAGTALYWGEGNKKTRKVRFTNSDPAIILLILKWLSICFHIKTSQLKAFVGINISHSHRETKILKYWSKTTKIPLNQFNKTILKKTPNIKIYDNPETYFGTITICVLKPIKLYYKILGLIEALNTRANNRYIINTTNTSQGSSAVDALAS